MEERKMKHKKPNHNLHYFIAMLLWGAILLMLYFCETQGF